MTLEVWSTLAGIFGAILLALRPLLGLGERRMIDEARHALEAKKEQARTLSDPEKAKTDIDAAYKVYVYQTAEPIADAMGKYWQNLLFNFFGTLAIALALALLILSQEPSS